MSIPIEEKEIQNRIEEEIGIPKPEFLKSLKCHYGTVSMSAFNSNNKQVISSSLDGGLILWDLNNLTKPKLGKGHTMAINDLSVSPSGFFIATASSDKTIRLWSNQYDYSSNGELQSVAIKHHTAPVKSVNFSCDSRLLCSGSDDQTIKITNVADRRLMATLTGHTNWVKTVQFNRDAKLIASGSDDKTLRLWDVARKELCFTFDNGEHHGAVNSVRFHPDNSCLATACFDSKIRLFDIRSKQLIQVYNHHKAPATCVAFHPSGNYLASTSYDETIKIYDLRMGDILFTLEAHEGAIMHVNFSNFGDFMSTGGHDSQVIIWKTNLDMFSKLSDSLGIVHSYPTADYTGMKETNIQPQVEKLKYKNHMAKEVKATNSTENTAEGLTKLFEQMVSQMDMITSSFVNFEKRVEKMEDMIDEINKDEE
ncbi:MAG: WD40 repeat domain-containing protein [archaeon]|nr:WD40 repeat domain-containing protein [archaeon]